MSGDIKYPRGPHSKYFFDSLRPEDKQRHIGLELLLPVIGTSSDDLYRLGAGGRIDFPVGRFSVGGGYISNFVPTSKTFKGHHIEFFWKSPQS